jgi:protein-disulfide isomerase
VLAANQQLMNDLYLYGTPALVYLDPHAGLKVFAGKPDQSQLAQILATHLDSVLQNPW